MSIQKHQRASVFHSQTARAAFVWVTWSASLLRLCWAVIPFPAAHAPLTCSPPEFLSSDRTDRRLLLLFKRQPGTLNICLRSCFLACDWSLRTYSWWFAPVLGRRGGWTLQSAATPIYERNRFRSWGISSRLSLMQVVGEKLSLVHLAPMENPSRGLFDEDKWASFYSFLFSSIHVFVKNLLVEKMPIWFAIMSSHQQVTLSSIVFVATCNLQSFGWESCVLLLQGVQVFIINIYVSIRLLHPQNKQTWRSLGGADALNTPPNSWIQRFQLIIVQIDKSTGSHSSKL